MKLRTTTPDGGPASRRTVLFAVAFLFGLPLVFVGWWGASKIFDSTSTSHYEASPSVQRVVLDTGDVNVAIREAAVPAVTIDTTSTYFIDEPSITHVLDGTALKVKADCGSSWTISTCDTDMTILVPHGVDVSLDGGAGDVDMFDLTGTIAIKSDAGDVSGLGLLGGDVLAMSTTGDVSLDLARSPQRLDVSTSTGDIDLVVPSADYAVDVKSDAGDTNVSGITDDGSSTRSIRSVSDVGDISIAGRPGV
jgi:hypothetical protein